MEANKRSHNGATPGQLLQGGADEARREAARLMGRVSTPAKAEAARLNGRKGGGKACKALTDIPCTCGRVGVLDAEGHPVHPTTCPRGRAIRHRLKRGLPLT